jgi:dTDP-4-dehydrorhamnose reductase
MKTKVLVTGAGGQLGIDVVDRIGQEGVVTAADHASLDVGDRDAVLGAVGGLGPDIIINCAAWTAVDACEGDPVRAFRDNALSARFLNEAADRFEAHLLTISTDYVFDGSKESPYHEWDEPNPQSVYGASKLGGEREIDGRGCVVRTAWVMGPHGNNMAKTVLRLLDEHDELSFVDDQRGCPSFTGDLADRIWQLASQRQRGVFHLTNAGAVSWFEFVRNVAELSGQDPERIRPITTAELDPPRPAPRPANSVLENRALASSGFAPLRDFREPLAETIATLA